MPVFGKMTKDELKELLGLSPDELNEKLTALGASTAEIEGIKNKLAVLDTFQASLDELKGTLNGIVTRLNSNNNNNNNNNGNENNGGNNGNQLPSVLEDEDGAINGRINARLAPVAQLAVETRAEMAYLNFKALHNDFSAFETDIRKKWNELPVNLKLKADQAIEDIYYSVKGKKVTDDGNKVTFFIENGSNGNSSATNSSMNNNNSGKKPEDLLSDEEKKSADKWGVSYADFAKQKGAMRYA